MYNMEHHLLAYPVRKMRMKMILFMLILMRLMTIITVSMMKKLVHFQKICIYRGQQEIMGMLLYSERAIQTSMEILHLQLTFFDIRGNFYCRGWVNFFQP